MGVDRPSAAMLLYSGLMYFWTTLHYLIHSRRREWGTAETEWSEVKMVQNDYERSHVTRRFFTWEPAW